MKVKTTIAEDFENSKKLKIEGDSFSKELTLSNYQLTDGGLKSRVSQFVEKFSNTDRSDVIVELGEGL